ncbi:hypothetical protein ACERII_07265 [Evansella sp. AB-rgal1]|uniref:SecDF P1 head subdomain-containing protein n=1 Tax=Evansella sp. AB-rgal1 TaxID=3242696 RepID=UPI00359EA0AA
MKKLSFYIIIMILPFVLLACSHNDVSTNDPGGGNKEIVLKDADGNTLATETDFVPESAKTTFEQGIRTLAIEVEFKDGSKLEEITSANKHKTIHIYYGDELLASPVVSDVITTGSIIISGGFSEELAKEIVEYINSL